LYAPIPHQRNAQTFRSEKQRVRRDHHGPNGLRQLEMNGNVCAGQKLAIGIPNIDFGQKRVRRLVDRI
jgi:hypothetical protein